MAAFRDANHLLITNQARLEQRLAKQLGLFLSRTVASSFRPAQPGKYIKQAQPSFEALNPQTGLPRRHFPDVELPFLLLAAWTHARLISEDAK